MNTSKPWYLSKTIWAAMVSVAATIGTMIGIDVDAGTREQMTDALLQIVSALAGVTAIFGRITANSRIL